jgi:hypothetical protein
VPPEVSAFAAEQGVSTELPIVLEMTRRVFPQASLRVQIEDDPENANDRHIVVLAENVNLPVSAALDSLYQWHREMFTLCPAPLVCVFRLGLEGTR